MRELSEIYPAETQAVLGYVDETVFLSNRATYVRESQGFLIYFPIELKNMEGLLLFELINNICSNNDIKTLYYWVKVGRYVSMVNCKPTPTARVTNLPSF